MHVKVPPPPSLTFKMDGVLIRFYTHFNVKLNRLVAALSSRIRNATKECKLRLFKKVGRNGRTKCGTGVTPPLIELRSASRFGGSLFCAGIPKSLADALKRFHLRSYSVQLD